MIVKIVLLLFYLFAALLPWQTVYFLREVFVAGEKWEYGTIGIYVSDVFLVSFLFCVGFLHWRKIASFFSDGEWKSSRIFVLSFLFFSYLLASMFWSSDPLLTSFIAVKILFIFLFVLAVRYTSFSLKIVFAVLTLSMLGHAVLALWQFLVQGDFASTLLGMSQHESWRGGVSVIESSTGRWFRAYGGFFHPNVLGVVMGVMSLFSLGGMYLLRETRVWRAAYLIASIIFFAALVVSFSRTGMIGFLVGFTLLLFLARKRLFKGKVFWKVFCGLIFSYGVVLTVFLCMFGDLFFTRVAGQARLEQLSVTERTSQVSEAISVVASAPIFGIGVGTYTQHVRSLDGSDALPVWVYQPVHNIDLLMLAELGIVGSLLLLALFFFVLKDILLTWNGLRGVQIFFVASIAAYVASMLFDHWQWDSHFGLIFFAFFAGIFLSLQTKKDSR